ncbi:hypothetical protein PIB30_099069 [Stylosanthes scabra]|uniref:Uncharacterized protein n=1 Tax=Stylosanthes scabra TaxID=79078 RepID=A0ABU6ZVG3_9FABA|nr:hypothetical protein [Stylosanthes scabra]
MPVEGELPASSNIEGYFLAKCIPRFASANSLTTNFWFMFKKFLEVKNFAYDEKINLGPFSDRSPEKSWYRPVRFEVNHPKERVQQKSNRIWARFLSEQLLPIGFPQHPKERFEVKLHALHFMARQLDFAQATPAPLSMIEIEQAHQLKINSLDSLLAPLSSNEDRKQQFKPFECTPCMMATRAFNVWWTTYYKKFIRPFDAIKSGADKLLAEDQPQRPKPAPKRKADPSVASKKTTKKTKTEKASVSSRISKTKRLIVPPAPSSPLIPVPAPEPSNVQFDAFSGTKISEDSAWTHSQQISPISCRPKSPEIISKEAKETTQPEGVEKDSHASSSDTQTEIGPQSTTAEKTQPPPKPDFPHESGDFLLDIENLMAKLHKATSETVVEKTGHSDSLNKSVQQEVHRAIEEEPIMDRPLTPATQYSIGAEVLNALRWLIDLLNVPID